MEKPLTSSTDELGHTCDDLQSQLTQLSDSLTCVETPRFQTIERVRVRVGGVRDAKLDDA